MKKGDLITIAPIILVFLLPFAVALPNNLTGEIAGRVVVHGVKNPTDVLVYIEKVAGLFEPAQTPVVVDQIKRTYVPHLMGVLVGTEVEFVNSDNELHNVHARQSRKELFNISILSQRKTRRIFNQIGIVTLLCDVHPEMSAFILVSQNPFFAQPDKNGNYVIKNIPAGTYWLVAWHEKAEPRRREVTVSEGGRVSEDFELRR